MAEEEHTLPPMPGNPLTPKQFEELLGMVGQRQKNFKDELPVMSMSFVFLNAGDRYSHVECREEGCDWKGFKNQVNVGGDGTPYCGNNHQGKIFVTKAVRLGWVEVPQ